MKTTITIDDLNAAIALPWDTKTCLVSQCVMRATKKKVESAGHYTFIMDDKEQIIISNNHIAAMFDEAHDKRGSKNYDSIRKLLPLEITLDRV